MRTRLIVTVLTLGCLAFTQPAEARRHRVSVGMRVGVGGWWGYGPGWYGPGSWPGWYVPEYYGVVPMDVGAVDTDISPEHARVYLDGTLIGTADDFDGHPSYLFLKPGRYTLEFKLQGYATETVALDVSAGQFFPLDTKLARIPGERAASWFDRPKGLPVGRVFGPSRSEPVVTRSGPDPSLRPGLRLERDVAQLPAPPAAAALELKVRPGNASVYVDGQFVGTADELARLERGLSVTAGEHRIEALAPGHAPRSISVSVAEGQLQQVVVELETATGQT